MKTPIAKGRSRRGKWALVLVALLSCLAPAADAAAAGEYQVKAAFLYNFARFVDWPSSAAGGASFVLCILGDDPFGGEINVIAGKAVGGKTLQVRRLASAAAVSSCQMLFISASESGSLGQALAAARGRPILTVGDTPGFAERGVAINLYVDQSKVRFEINLDAAKRAQLNISSQLLKLARITKDKGASNG